MEGISLFLRHLFSGSRTFGVKTRMASRGKLRILNGMFKSSAPTAAGDRYGNARGLACWFLLVGLGSSQEQFSNGIQSSSSFLNRFVTPKAEEVSNVTAPI